MSVIDLKRVWVVWHIDHNAPSEAEEHEKLIGVYSTRKLAEEAVERLRDKPGFRDFPDRWSVDDWLLDQVHWSEGFATILPGEYE